nr:hypothetical protein [uncultured Methanospirillum sp.]
MCEDEMFVSLVFMNTVCAIVSGILVKSGLDPMDITLKPSLINSVLVDSPTT